MAVFFKVSLLRPGHRFGQGQDAFVQPVPHHAQFAGDVTHTQALL